MQTYVFRKNIFNDNGNIIFLKNEHAKPLSISKNKNGECVYMDFVSNIDKQAYTFYHKHLYEESLIIDECLYTTEEYREIQLNKII